MVKIRLYTKNQFTVYIFKNFLARGRGEGLFRLNYTVEIVIVEPVIVVKVVLVVVVFKVVVVPVVVAVGAL